MKRFLWIFCIHQWEQFAVYEAVSDIHGDCKVFLLKCTNCGDMKRSIL